MRRALNIYAWFVVGATLVLISIGGHVTTKGAGLAVPDWPLSFGELNPPGWWELPSVRLEHGHRLVGALIGLLTLILTGWTFASVKDRFARGLVLLAVVVVILQGILGGLRVNLVSTNLAIVHGCLGQVFLLILASCAMRLHWLTRLKPFAATGTRLPPALARLCLVFPTLVFIQLIVAAVMRHHQAGMAIPDFPLAFGQIIPPLTTFPVTIHFAHRVLALGIAVLVISLPLLGAFRYRQLRWLVVLSLLLVACQIALGAGIVLTGRNATMTTMHVVTGATVLLAAFIIGVRAWILTRAQQVVYAAPSSPDRSVFAPLVAP